MYQHLPHTIQALQHKLQKIGRQLQQVLLTGKQATACKIKSLTKRRDKYARQLLSLTAPLSKAAGVLAVAALVSTGAEAQTCRQFTNANAANPITVQGIPNSKQPYFVDIDGDGDLDCYVLDAQYYYDAPFLLKNIGNNKLPVYQYRPKEGGFPQGSGTLSRSATNAQFIDIDGDGDYDCFLSEAYGLFGGGDVHIEFFENQGTATHPDFERNEAKNPVAFARGNYYIGFTFADIDGDGDYDLYYYDDFSSRIYENAGSKTNAVFVYSKTVSSFKNLYDRTYYDWNRDGLLDYFQEGTYYKNIGPKKNPKYVADNADGPVFDNGLIVHQFADINSDGSPEAVDIYRDFSTLAPVPLIDTSTVKRGGKTYLQLSVSPVAPGFSYRWYLGKQPVANARGSSIVALSGGYYTAAITDSCGTGNSLPYLVSSQASSSVITQSIPGLPGSPVAKTYPNPFTSAFVLQLGTVHTPAATVTITDMQGRVVSSVTPSGSSIRLGSELQRGIYILRVWQDNKVVFTQKIVKE